MTRVRPHYAWIVAGVAFFVLLVSAGIRAVPGVFVVPLETEFGWSRATISLAISVNLVLYGLMGPFAAALMERLGVRRTMLLALTALALGVGATTLMTRPWKILRPATASTLERVQCPTSAQTPNRESRSLTSEKT